MLTSKPQVEIIADTDRSALMRFVVSSIRSVSDKIQVRLCQDDEPYHHFLGHRRFKLAHGLIWAIGTSMLSAMTSA